MESNKQTEPKSKIEADSQIAGWQLRGSGGGGIGQKGKRAHGHGQQCDDCWGEGGIRRLNDNGKMQ